MKKVVWLSAVIALLMGCSERPEPSVVPEPFELIIAHINDTHSAFDPVPASFRANELTVYNEFGGHPRLLEQANAYRAIAVEENTAMLFLHGGDAWQGSAYFQINEGRMNADILSRMNIDAMALGNHEFDLTNAHLNEFLTRINFPLLAANIDTSRDPDLKDQGNLRAYTLFAFDGYQKQRFDDLTELQNLPEHYQIVGVFGLALDDMPNISPHVGEVEFFDVVTSAQAMVDAFHAHGVYNIVAVTHLGHSVDVAVAEQVNGIDVIVGGHSHTLLGDFTDLGLGHAGDYAQWVQNPNGIDATCIVQAGEYAQAIGKVRVHFASDGRLTNCAGQNVLLSNDDFFQSSARHADSRMTQLQSQQVLDFIHQHPAIDVTAEHADLRAHIDAVYKPAVEQAYGQVIGMLPDTLVHVRRPGDGDSDHHGSQVAPLIALAQFEWANSAAVQEVTGTHVDFALLGAGGIRQNLAEGELREGDVTLELLPFSNFLSILPLTGAEVKALLEEAIIATLPAGSHAGKFPYGGNLRYAFAETERHRDGQITKLEVNRGTWLEPDWQPLDLTAQYQVLMNSYSATGNDGWMTVFRSQQERSARLDLAYTEGQLTVYPVARLSQQDNRLVVHYADEELQCDLATVQCNTDALAVVEFIRDTYMPARGAILPIPYPVVTLKRLE